MKKQISTLAVMMLVSSVATANLSQQSIDASARSLKSMSQALETLGAGSVNFASDGAELSKQALLETIALAGKAVNSTSNAISDGAEFVADTTVSAAKAGSKMSGQVSDAAQDAAASTSKAVSKGAKSASDKAVSAASAIKKEVIKSANSASNASAAAAEFSVEKVEWSANKTSQIVEVTLKSIKNGTVMVAKFSYNSASDVGQAMINASKSLFEGGKRVIVATSTAGVVLVTESANGVERVLEGEIKAGTSQIVTSVSASGKAFGSKLVK